MEGLDFVNEYSSNVIVAGVLFGVVGMILIKVARKTTNAELYFVAVALMGYPYFVTDDIMVWVVGFALLAVAFMIVGKKK